MENIQVFNNAEFGQVRTILFDDTPWFLADDVCKNFGCSNTSMAIKCADLDKDECKSLSFKAFKQTGIAYLWQGNDFSNKTIINESGLYSLLFSLQPTKARGVDDEIINARIAKLKAFKHWVTSEVLPQIRKTGGYVVAKEEDTPEVIMARGLMCAKEALERQAKLLAEKDKIIGGLEVKSKYLDLIMKSTDSLNTTQVAQDYGYSAVEFNKILNDLRIQRNVNGQWILYADYLPLGWVTSKLLEITHKDGTKTFKAHTYWTNKGRMGLYYKLKENNILPMIERRSA